MDSLNSIREACARLRRLPEPLWGQPPREPLGARPPHIAPTEAGPTIEVLVRGWVATLMRADATARGVAQFDVQVQRLALPDALEAIAKSAATQVACADELAAVAAEISAARL